MHVVFSKLQSFQKTFHETQKFGFINWIDKVLKTGHGKEGEGVPSVNHSSDSLETSAFNFFAEANSPYQLSWQIQIFVFHFPPTQHHSFLRLLRTFAGILGEKIRMRAILKENTANYISLESLINVDFGKK